MNWLPSLFEETTEQRNKREMLLSLNGKARSRGEIFQGGDAAKVARTRRKNKAARKARRRNRG